MNFRGVRVVQAFMKKIMVGLAALALLAVVVPQAEAGQRHGNRHRSGHAISSHSGHYRTVIGHGHGYRRAYYPRHVRRVYRPYYSPYYGGYYDGYAPYSYGYGYGFPGISLSFGGGHHYGGHHGGHH